MIFRKNDVRANDFSRKWHSAERRFVKITFGYTTIRENNVRLNNDSEKCRSAIWSFGNSTIRLCDDSVKLRSVFFFPARKQFSNMTFRETSIRLEVSAKQQFGEMTFRENDLAPKNRYDEESNWRNVGNCKVWMNEGQSLGGMQNIK